MIDSILTELEEQVAATRAGLDALRGDPDSNSYHEMLLRGQLDGLLDAINTVKIVNIRSILAAKASA